MLFSADIPGVCVCKFNNEFFEILIIQRSRGPKLGTYSDWGLSSVLVINKHLSHHPYLYPCQNIAPHASNKR